MWIALDIFIGLTLCYTLISLFCSVIQEFIAQALDSRGKLLVEALKGVDLDTIIVNVSGGPVKNPGWLFRIPWLNAWGDNQSTPPKWVSKVSKSIDDTTGGRRLPHDMSPASLALALVQGSNLLVSGTVAQNFDATVQGMSIPVSLKSRLLGLSASARLNVDLVKQEVETWFRDFIQQVQHWYVRRAQATSLIIGLLVALSFNIDTIEIAQRLYHDAPTREAVVRSATQLAKDGKLLECPEAKARSEANTPTQKPPKGEEMKDKGSDPAKLVNDCRKAIEKIYPFGIGWSRKDVENVSNPICKAWAIVKSVTRQLFDGFKFLGLLLTGLALSLGSRFWFDMLKNLVALRTGGQPDKKVA